jgi:hypothetical protein
MQENELHVKTSVNTRSKNKKTLIILVSVIVGLTVFSLLYAAVIYPSL